MNNESTNPDQRLTPEKPIHISLCSHYRKFLLGDEDNYYVSNRLLNVREEILEIVARYGGKNVRIFGSFARGDSSPNSDIDILIDLEPGRSLLDIVAIKQDLEDLLGFTVDVVTDAAVSEYIRDEVLKQGVKS